MTPIRRGSRRLARWSLATMLGAAALLFAQGGAQAQGPQAASAAPPLAPSRLDEITARGVLRVGSTGDYKPFSYRVGQTSQWVGMDIELATRLARAIGVQLEIVPTTWPTLMADFAADKFDVGMGGISVTLERQRKAFFSIPSVRDGKTPITRCENVQRFQTLAQIDVPEVHLIVNPGGTNERFARTHAPHAKLTVYKDNVTIFDRLVAGEADLMITDAVEARLQQRLHPSLCAVHPEAPFDFAEKAVLLPRDPVFKAFVDQWLHQEIESGSFRRTQERWLDYPWGLEQLRLLIDARLQLAPDVARYKWNRNAPIEDLPREAQLIAGLSRDAAALGVPLPWAEAFFKAQVEASKTLQREMTRGWEVMKAGPFPNVPDLATETRPRIDALTAQMMGVLAANATVLTDPARKADVARALLPIEAEALSVKAVEQALAPLLAAR